MTPDEIVNWELDHGKIWIENPLNKILAPLNVKMLEKYHDFLRDYPWGRSDN